MIAQTNLQLYRQLEAAAYTAQERQQVAEAYEVLMPMFSGLYRGSGKPFVCHLVATASILARERQAIELVLAGLLHAAYLIGDFGFDYGRGASVRKRKALLQLVGGEVEALLADYRVLVWDEQAVLEYCKNAHLACDRQRTLWTLALANTLDDLQDYGLALQGAAKSKPFRSLTMQSGLLELAHTLGLPWIKAGLEESFVELNSGHSPLRRRRRSSWSFLLLPPGARRRLLPRLAGFVGRRWRLFRRNTA